MDILYFFQSIRNPVLDAVFGFFTLFGEETVFLALGIFLFWCVNKQQGYYILSLGLLGTVVNQVLKLVFRVPRPWVKDPNFTIVESARAEATGYSFPSGHTQTSVGLFGGIARWGGQKWLRILCLVLCVMVPLSRLYLGVHTLEDVLVSAAIAVAMVLLLRPMFATQGRTRVVMAGMSLCALLAVLYCSLAQFPADPEGNVLHGVETCSKMLGCTLGMWLTFEVDARKLHFETTAKWYMQIVKLVLGLVPVLLIKALLKSPLNAVLGNAALADGVRYFLLTAFAGCVWPLTFRRFAKQGK